MCLCTVFTLSLSFSPSPSLRLSHFGAWHPFLFVAVLFHASPLLAVESWPCDPNNQLHLCSLCSWFTINNGFAFAKHYIQRNQARIFIISLSISMWEYGLCHSNVPQWTLIRCNVCARICVPILLYVQLCIYLQQCHSMIWPLEMHRNIEICWNKYAIPSRGLLKFANLFNFSLAWRILNAIFPLIFFNKNVIWTRSSETIYTKENSKAYLHY